MQRPTRDDLVYVGVTLTSALAIAVAGTQQLSDWWRTPSQQQARTDAPVTSAAPLATSPVANVALLQLLEKGPEGVARAAVNATTPPVTAIADAALSSPSTAPVKTADARARRATSTRRAATNAARNAAPREHGVRASAAAAIASPPLRLPESYVQPRLVSQEGGRRRGQVVLAVQVRPNGRVGDIEVLSKDDDRGYDDLERAAVSAVKRWRYRPALRDGVPTPSRVKVVVNFS
jgi:periplasmic protein TonB